MERAKSPVTSLASIPGVYWSIRGYSRPHGRVNLFLNAREGPSRHARAVPPGREPIAGARERRARGPEIKKGKKVRTCVKMHKNIERASGREREPTGTGVRIGHAYASCKN